jgi:putative ABC transport system permease protein
MRIRLVIFALIDLFAAGWLALLLVHKDSSSDVSIMVAAVLFVLAMIGVALDLFYPAVFGLVFKQMRQRALGSSLTLLSVLLGVALAVAVLLVRRESSHLFGQSDFGYELIVGPPKGADLSLVLSTVYQLGDAKGTVPYKVYTDMVDRKGKYHPLVRQAIPIMVGDSYRGRRIVGTSPQMFGYDDNGNYVPASEDHHPWEYRIDRNFEMEPGGRAFLPARFEAVIGSDVAARLNMCTAADKDKPENKGKVWNFQATHGMPPPGAVPEIHKPVWQVVGILKPTHTAADRALYIPVISLYSIAEHSYGLIQQAMLKAGIDPSKVTAEEAPATLTKLGYNPDEVPASVMRKLRSLGFGRVSASPGAMQPPTSRPTAPSAAPGDSLMRDVSPTPPAVPKPTTEPAGGSEQDEPDAYKLDPQGNIVPDIPEDEWALSAILIKARGPFQASTLEYDFRVANPDAMAVSPASTMREFFDTFLKGSTLLLLALAALVSVVAAVGILVSIYNSVSARQREIAILRALGATRGKVLGLICLEAGVIGLIGGVLGLAAGHLVGAGGSIYFEQVLGEGIRWTIVSVDELYYLVAVVVIAVLAGLVPALKAYSTPVATNLVAS